MDVRFSSSPTAATAERAQARSTPTPAQPPPCAAAHRPTIALAGMAEEGGINLQALSFDQLNQLKQSIEEVCPLHQNAPGRFSVSDARLSSSRSGPAGASGPAGCARAPQDLG